MTNYNVLPIQPLTNWLIKERDSSVATQPVYTDEEELILGRSSLHVYKQELDTTKKYTIITENRSGNAYYGLTNSNTDPTNTQIQAMTTSNGFTTEYNKIIIEHNGTNWTATVNDETAWTITNSTAKYIILATNVEGNSVEAMKIRTILEE